MKIRNTKIEFSALYFNYCKLKISQNNAVREQTSLHERKQISNFPRTGRKKEGNDFRRRKSSCYIKRNCVTSELYIFLKCVKSESCKNRTVCICILNYIVQYFITVIITLLYCCSNYHCVIFNLTVLLTIISSIFNSLY